MAENIKLNFNEEITGIDGNPILKQIKEDPKTKEKLKIFWTYKDVFVEFIQTNMDKTLSGKEKLERHLLAVKIYQSKEETSLTINEIKLLKTLAEKIENTLFSAVCQMFLPE